MTSIGLARQGVWPGDGRNFASARDLAAIFAREVLGWDQADVVLHPAAPSSPGGLAITHGPDRSVWALAAPLQSTWTFMQIGNEPGMSAHADGANTLITIPAGPHGTASLRWWALVHGQETTGVHPAPTGPLLIPGAIEQLDTVLALYLDDHQAALGAIGGDFGNQAPVERPNQP